MIRTTATTKRARKVQMQMPNIIAAVFNSSICSGLVWKSIISPPSVGCVNPRLGWQARKEKLAIGEGSPWPANTPKKEQCFDRDSKTEALGFAGSFHLFTRSFSEPSQWRCRRGTGQSVLEASPSTESSKFPTISWSAGSTPLAAKSW